TGFEREGTLLGEGEITPGGALTTAVGDLSNNFVIIGVFFTCSSKLGGSSLPVYWKPVIKCIIRIVFHLLRTEYPIIGMLSIKVRLFLLI
ncbi:MAG: hypothetical protein AAF349_28730, partial [Cyanobacteria bacterium P01_A01_bin.68]